VTQRRSWRFEIGVEGWLLLLSLFLLLCSLVTPMWNVLERSCTDPMWLIDVRNWSWVGWLCVFLTFAVALLVSEWYFRHNEPMESGVERHAE
jgi:hypothetical protein